MYLLTTFVKYIKDMFFWNLLVKSRSNPLNMAASDHFTLVTRQVAEPVFNCTWCKSATQNDCICGMCNECHSQCFNFTYLGKKIAKMKDCSSTCELALAYSIVKKR